MQDRALFKMNRLLLEKFGFARQFLKEVNQHLLVVGLEPRFSLPYTVTINNLKA